jgi:glucokinase
MEIGHIPVVAEGSQCGCGRRGCLETVASRLSISAECAKAAYRGQAPHLLKEAGTDLANIRSGALASAIKSGDKIIERIVRDAARHLGRAIAAAVNMLAPDVIVLGGGLVEAMPKLYLDEVGEAVQRQVMPSFQRTYQLTCATLGDEAGTRGAAAWAKQTATKAEPSSAAYNSEFVGGPQAPMRRQNSDTDLRRRLINPCLLHRYWIRSTRSPGTRGRGRLP